MNILNIFDKPTFDESVTNYQYHTYLPPTESFDNNDEIRILIQQQDVYTLPSQSYLEIEGILTGIDAQVKGDLTRNAYCYLFEEIRYEINSVEVDKIRDVGTTTTIKNYLCCNNQDARNALYGWQEKLVTYDEAKKKFIAQIPLNKLIGFAEGYGKILTNVRQEIILLRSSTDNNSFIANNEVVKIDIEKIVWRVPHIEINDELKIKLYNNLNKDVPIIMPFRKWELHELPSLRTTNHDIWSVKTSTSLERPRYVIVCFQENNKRNNREKNVTEFMNANIRNIRVHLNSTSYPYDNLNLDFTNSNFALAYNMYCNFQQSYYNLKDKNITPYISFSSFKNNPLFVFDVSKQNESVKIATIDLKIEIEARAAFPANTSAYCLILYDSIMEYTPLSGLVRKII